MNTGGHLKNKNTNRMRAMLALWLLVFTGSTLAETTTDRLVVITAPGKVPAASKAATLKVTDLVVVATDTEGQRNAWQKDFYVGSAPLYPDEPAAVTMRQAQAALNEYSTLIKKLPEVPDMVEQEKAKWEQLLVTMKKDSAQDAAELEKELNEKIENFLTRPYDIAAQYQPKLLERLLELGAELSEQAPERADEIASFLQPWKQHLESLNAGLVVYEGAWVTQEQLREKRAAANKEAMARFVEDGVKLQMPAVVVPQMSVLLVVSLVILVLVLVIYMFLHLASSRGGTLTFGGTLALLTGLALIGGYIYYGYLIFNAPSTIDQYLDLGESANSQKDRQVLERALFISSKPEGLRLVQPDFEIQLSDIQINQLLKNNTEYVRIGESELFDLERVEFATVFLNDRVIFVDEVVIFGKPFLLRYELPQQISNDTISFDRVEAYFGGARMPAQLMSFFWMKLRPDIISVIEHTGVTDIYELSNVEEGYISLILTSQPMPSSEDMNKAGAGQ